MNEGGLGRVVSVKVRDAQGGLLGPTTIVWTEGGQPRGSITSSEGHVTLHPASEDSSIGITVDYRGERKEVTLAPGQNAWELTFDLAPGPGKPAGNQASSPSGSTATGGRVGGAGSMLKNAKVLIALIGAVSAIVVAWLQFGPKPSLPADDVQLAVYALDAKTKDPVTVAQVTLQRGIRVETIAVDSKGAVIFKLDKGHERNLKVIARANGYEGVEQNIERPGEDRRLDLLLSKASPTTQATVAPGASGVATPKAANAPLQKSARTSTPSGTWQIQIDGDPAVQRAGSGTFSFAPQSDGTILVSANFKLDGVSTRLEGSAGRTGSQLFLTFDATADTHKWKGRGDLEMVGTGQMRGRIVDSKGGEIGVNLRKP